MPSEDITPGPNTSGQNTPSSQPKPDGEPTEDISISRASSQRPVGPTFQLEGEDIQRASSSPKRSIKLEDVIALHTARRMKGPSKSGQKLKQGVSIPSQRRWLYYWSVVLTHVSPPGFWGVGVVSSSSDPSPKAPLTLPASKDAAAHPKIRLRQNYSSDARAYGHEEGSAEGGKCLV